MNFFEILLISIGLAMDSFAVSICKGLAIKKIEFKNILTVGLYFAIFQGGMPILGYLFGSIFGKFITNIDHWVAFCLLSFIGINMIRESFKEEKIDSKLDFKTMIILAIATSIDALTVGITFTFLKVNIWTASIIIGITTFIMSVIGIKIGNKFGNKLGNKAQILGGIILIILGTKILLEHLEII